VSLCRRYKIFQVIFQPTDWRLTIVLWPSKNVVEMSFRLGLVIILIWWEIGYILSPPPPCFCFRDLVTLLVLVGAVVLASTCLPLWMGLSWVGDPTLSWRLSRALAISAWSPSGDETSLLFTYKITSPSFNSPWKKKR
jgi:hypothetical protein